MKSQLAYQNSATGFCFIKVNNELNAQNEIVEIKQGLLTFYFEQIGIM